MAEEIDEDLFLLWLDQDLDADTVWRDLQSGPSVDELTARLSTTPAWFLEDSVDVLALAGDVLDVSGGPALDACARIAASGKLAARQGAAIALWLVASQDLAGPLAPPLRPELLHRALVALAFRLAAVVGPRRWIEEAERREEAVRTFLLWSGQLPAGEVERNARALLARLDSPDRAETLDAARRERAHRAEVRRRLEDARAREAATRYNPE